MAKFSYGSRQTAFQRDGLAVLPVHQLSDSERAVFRMVLVFLSGRLGQRETVDWALSLKSEQQAEKAAVTQLLEHPSPESLKDPWKSAWSLLLEFWTEQSIHTGDFERAYGIKSRLHSGDLSGRTVSLIVDLVRPKVSIKPRSEQIMYEVRKRRSVRTVRDLLYASMTSGKVVNPDDLGLSVIKDTQFLIELAHGLDAAVHKGVDLGRRIGWDGSDRIWQLGSLNRVYYVSKEQRPPNEHEPDEFHDGIAPSVKLLVYVVQLLSKFKLDESKAIVAHWQSTFSPVHIRMWCAMARDSRLTDGAAIAIFLRSCNFRKFWNLSAYPEIAELRAVRFNDLSEKDRTWLLERIRRGPPKSYWRRDIEQERLETAKEYNAVREMRRLDLAGAELSPHYREWLEDGIRRFSELAKMVRLDSGFPGMQKAQWVAPNPDDIFDEIVGDERLAALEKSLSSTDRNWPDDPSERATDWIRQEGRVELILSELEQAKDAGAAYPEVWERFCWTHQQPKDRADDEIRSVATRVLDLLCQLPESTLKGAIEGITFWLSSWEQQIVFLPQLIDVWMRLWPIAAAATDKRYEEKSASESDIGSVVDNDDHKETLDTLNDPAGRMVGVFLVFCGHIQDLGNPVTESMSYKKMSDAVTETAGHSGLVARYRALEFVSWFVNIDREWVEETLLKPLLEDSEDALLLWDAVALRTQSKDVLRLIGDKMAVKAVDLSLSRRARRNLAWNLVLETLHAILKDWDASIKAAEVTQMIRSLDDEVRAHAADTVRRFVIDLSLNSKQQADSTPREELFEKAARPFIESVWPQEQSLTSAGVSRSFARLPSACGDQFVAAVDTVERFLVPFDCWSLYDYELGGGSGEQQRLSMIDSEEKANALLRLLDSTVGTKEGAVVPHDLGQALERVREISSQLAKSRTYRRLATLGR